MATEPQLRPSEAVKYISVWLTRNNYSHLFKNDLGLLLAENRRTRNPNTIKYGRIPYYQNAKGKIYYDLGEIRNFCETRLNPICKELEKARLEKAAKAADGARLPYAA